MVVPRVLFGMLVLVLVFFVGYIVVDFIWNVGVAFCLVCWYCFFYMLV